jgi:serine/threonine-protein kinase
MIGETLGSYRIVSEIGQGGMGVVYAAEHTLLGRKAAVKVLRSGLDGEHVDRFFNEARAAARLHHPGLVEVFDFGNHDGRAFIVMELLVGESMAARLEREPRLPFSLAGAITRAVANALHVAHQEGIIHRDLKPANLFLIEDSEAATGLRAKVLDFGIAKLVRDEQPRSVKTHSGAVIGTPRYMSPEQCRNARNVDARADVYSLGCILYEMVLGVTPFDYDTWAELVGAHLYEEPPRPRELDPALPPEIEALITKMIEKAPEHRFATMAEVARALEEALKLPAVTRAASEPPARPSKPPAPQKVQAATDPTMPLLGKGAVPAATPAPVSGIAKTFDNTPSSVPAAAPEAARKSNRVWWLVGGGAALAATAGAVAIAMSRGSGGAPEEAVVTIDDRTQKPPPPTPPVDPAPKPVDPVAQLLPPETPRDAGARAPTEVDTAQLTRAFAKHTGAVTHCFRDQHVETSEQLSVRFQIDVKGHVVSANVLPESAAGTPLGKCIEGVAHGVAFGPQPRVVTFRAPIQATAKAN